LSFVYYVGDTQATAYGMHSGVSESILFIKHLSTIPGTPSAKQRSNRLCAVCHHRTTWQDRFPLLRLSLIRPKSGERRPTLHPTPERFPLIVKRIPSPYPIGKNIPAFQHIAAPVVDNLRYAPVQGASQLPDANSFFRMNIVNTLGAIVESLTIHVDPERLAWWLRNKHTLDKVAQFL
jgi:hypothetical protein